MPFDRYIAIDWSGAQDEIRDGKIQVAEYNPGNQSVAIVRSPVEGSNGVWSRGAVFDQVPHWIEAGRVLIGFDFAFAYPYCDRNVYFPNHTQSPADRPHLWRTVDDVCAAEGNFYGGQFYRNVNSAFRPFYKYPSFEGHRYEPRLRVTDVQAENAIGVLPNSVFSCYGQRNVGTGSLAGMRFLRGLPQRLGVTIWPFDATEPRRSTLVEIYPRLFLNHAAGVRGNQLIHTPVAELVERNGVSLQGRHDGWTDDERDALISAAGMAWFANQQATWDAPTRAPACAATYEGWIFGVQ